MQQDQKKKKQTNVSNFIQLESSSLVPYALQNVPIEKFSFL